MKFKSILFFLITFICTQCISQDEQPINPVPPDPSTEKYYTYLALGDSYTIGQSVAENERYPIQLSDSLVAAGFFITETRIIAKTGWTTDELQNGIAIATGLRDTYSLVSLLIGVNNQYRGRPVETYKPEFTELLNQAIDFAGGHKERVFVVSIPDYAFTPFGNGNTAISMGIDEYNAANKAIADSLGIRYFDITPISRKGLDEPDLVAGDHLHPSGGQYRHWVNLMFQDVKEMLNK